MKISDIKDLLSQFDSSSLREFTYQAGNEVLVFSKNDRSPDLTAPLTAPAPATAVAEVSPASASSSAIALEEGSITSSAISPEKSAEGDVVESPLVGVAYLAPAPDKPAFITVGDTVTKGQTLLIVEAMKVMNEIPAPCDGVVTEILVSNEDLVEYGSGLVRIK